MDEHEQTKAFLQSLKPGDLVALWRGHWSVKTPDIVKVAKVTKTQVEVEGWTNRFNRETGYEKGGSRDRYTLPARIDVITPEALRLHRRARNLRVMDRLRVADLSDAHLEQLATLVRKIMNERTAGDT